MRHALSSFVEMELRSANRRRHWSPSAQTYAPADVLLEYLADGWDISSVVSCEEHWYGAGRHYYFELNKGVRALVLLFENVISTGEPLHCTDIESRLTTELGFSRVSLPPKGRC